MDEFVVQVGYKGTLREFSGKLMQWGYTYKILVDVDGIQVTMEPDEDRNYRITVNPENIDHVDPKLIQVIMEELKKNLQ